MEDKVERGASRSEGAVAEPGRSVDVSRDFVDADDDFHAWLKAVAKTCMGKYVR